MKKILNPTNNIRLLEMKNSMIMLKSFLYLCGNDLRKFSPSKTKMMTDLNKSKATIEKRLIYVKR